MLPELSLNILDIVNNSIRAKADLIDITVSINTKEDTLTIRIADNGYGMDNEQLKNVEDPFFTTRTTRQIGLGIPFLKQAAIGTGGSFKLSSLPGRGTVVTAVFGLSHIDRMPLGDIGGTIYILVITNPDIDFKYTYELDQKQFRLDTVQFRKLLGDIPFDTPEVASFIKEFIKENQDDIDIMSKQEGSR